MGYVELLNETAVVWKRDVEEDVSGMFERGPSEWNSTSWISFGELW